MSLRLLHYSDIENAYDDPERIGRLAGAIESLRDEATVVCGTGDNTAPGILSLVTDGRQALEFFSRIEPDVETLGNHDFDHGFPAIRRIVEASPQQWVSANVRLDGERFGRDVGVVSTAVVDRLGERVGVFGLLDPGTPSINPKAADLTVTDPIEAARDAVSTLESEGVDHVVALSHLGRGDDDLARAVDVDVILGGHVHTERIESVDGTLCVRPGANGATLLELRYDGKWDAVRHDVTDSPTDEAVASALRNRMAAADLDEVVTAIEEPMDRSQGTVFGGESRIGNAVADAYRWATGADVGLQNSGGIREGPPLSGAVTVADLIGVIPFEEPVTVAEVTSEELRSVLREARGDRVDFGEPDWWHAHLSGARLVWDGEGLDRVTVGGEGLDPGATYTVATSDYLLHTEHEFPTLGEGHRAGSTDRTQYEVVIEYAREVGLDARIEDRIRGALP